MEFHAYGLYSWHYAKCKGMKERANHAHFLRSYDKEWMHKMHHLIYGGERKFKPLTDSELRQIELEAEASTLIQSRKSLEIFGNTGEEPRSGVIMDYTWTCPYCHVVCHTFTAIAAKHAHDTHKCSTIDLWKNQPDGYVAHSGRDDEGMI